MIVGDFGEKTAYWTDARSSLHEDNTKKDELPIEGLGKSQFTNRMLSSRSSIPPCPGIRAEESFTPTSRFKSDSARSPIWPITPTMMPMTMHVVIESPAIAGTKPRATNQVASAKTNPKAEPSH